MPKRHPVADQLAQSLNYFIGKPVKISFGDISFQTVLQEVRQATLAEMTNPPEPRFDGQGKKYTPRSVVLVCTDGKLFFVADDIIRSYIELDSCVIDMGNTGEVRIRLV